MLVTITYTIHKDENVWFMDNEECSFLAASVQLRTTLKSLTYRSKNAGKLRKNSPKQFARDLLNGKEMENQ